jgi:hypothetical protein
MSILDDAIREHLELKRQHGADEAELKRLEDEAFGPPGRPDEPDPFAEAPTEFMAAPEGQGEGAGEGGRRRINIADLQEPPEPPAADADAAPEAREAEAEAAPADEEPAAMEHETIPEPQEDVSEPEEEPGPSTEERHAIAEQPTQFFDVESEIADTEEPAGEAPSPSDEEIIEAEQAEPKLAPADPATEIYASRGEVAEEPPLEHDEEEDDFFSEQRLSDELDQALEAPVTDEHEAPPAPREIAEEDDEDDVDYDPDTGHEDVLEDTPDFLEDTPEDDELWFEQRPPKDFDFDD